MSNGERVFYTSENGDRWLLMSSGENTVSVRHVPNAASGGVGKSYDIGAFLMEERHSAQNQALRALISSLVRIDESGRGSSDSDIDLAERVEDAQKLDRD